MIDNASMCCKTSSADVSFKEIDGFGYYWNVIVVNKVPLKVYSPQIFLRNGKTAKSRTFRIFIFEF